MAGNLSRPQCVKLLHYVITRNEIPSAVDYALMCKYLSEVFPLHDVSAWCHQFSFIIDVYEIGVSLV